MGIFLILNLSSPVDDRGDINSIGNSKLLSALLIAGLVFSGLTKVVYSQPGFPICRQQQLEFTTRFNDKPEFNLI